MISWPPADLAWIYPRGKYRFDVRAFVSGVVFYLLLSFVLTTAHRFLGSWLVFILVAILVGWILRRAFGV